MTNAAQSFNDTNPYALSTIIDASATRQIVASQDILDVRGTKLLARGQPVSHSLQQRLLERKLMKPMETCLRVEDGVTPFELHDALTAFIESDHALAAVVAPNAHRLLGEAKQLPLHASVQVLLTAVQVTKPHVFAHAVRGMALAGAMQVSSISTGYDIRLAMLGGLLHDLGEMYVNPLYLDAGQSLDISGYRHVVTHPRIGEMLLVTATDYPAALSRAIGEHHERLDGNGYPLRRPGAELSPLGKLLAVVEVALALAEAPLAPLSRASFALRVVPGEFDEYCVGFVSAAASRLEDPADVPWSDSLSDVAGQLALLNTQINVAYEHATALAKRTDVSGVVRDAATRAALLLTRLRMGWNSLGLWAVSGQQELPYQAFELVMARNEMRYRMRCIQRDCLWKHRDVNTEDEDCLRPLWSDLEDSA